MKSLSRPMASKMFYEKRVTSFRALMKEASVMDSDAGIRVAGRYGKDRCYCFVTKFGSVFTVMIYTRSAKGRGSPLRLLASVELRNTEQLRRLFRRVVSPRIYAYVY